MNLNKYIAKTDNTTLEDHNSDLLNILNQVKNIYNINDNLIDSLDKVIKTHDIGKIYTMTNDKIYQLRHEFIGSSSNELNFQERLAILLHHKSLKGIRERLRTDKKEYFKAKEFVEKELDIELDDMYEWIRKNNILFKIGDSNLELLHDFNLLFLKGYLNYCDHLASAGVKNLDTNMNTYNTFQKAFNNNFNSIQKEVLKLEKEDIIIQAPTGFGKSATAMLWSHKQQNKDLSKRIFYILPYTTSINSLYKQFKNDFQLSTGMLHSKAEYFLSKELEEYKSEYQLFKKSVKQITICTIFQLIKAFFGCKNFEMTLSQMKNSIFIIDEVHCFDIREFCFIVEMLKYLKENFNISICIMSASIPSCMLNLIKDRLNIKTVINPFEDKSKSNLEKLKPRHKLFLHDEYIYDYIDNIKIQIKEGKKVLICVNKIDKAQKIYEELKKFNPRLIHGRFNMRDREKIEQGLDDCKILIGTQAIEVSLDIDYDIMFTEIAPYDALLQRFGRINRKGIKGVSEIHIFEEENGFYDKLIINNTREVIREIILKDDRIVYEDKANYYLDKVYTYIDMEQYIKYQKIIWILFNNWKVGYTDNISDEELINSTYESVLPIVLFDEYNTYIKNKQYLKANSLFVSIPKRKINKKNSTIHNDITIIKYKYNDMGLIYEIL